MLRPVPLQPDGQVVIEGNRSGTPLPDQAGFPPRQPFGCVVTEDTMKVEPQATHSAADWAENH